MAILLENILISKDYTLSMCIILQNAAVVELVDTSDSKSDSRKGVTVQVRSAVPNCAFALMAQLDSASPS